MRYEMVPVKNVLMLGTALNTLSSRDEGVPGLGLLFGRAGFGKTFALARLAARERAIYFRAHSAITLSSLLEGICHKLGIDGGKGKNTDKFKSICNCLKDDPRPIFVDEGDYLLHDVRMLESLRDIHDVENVPVVLVGMKGIEQRLKNRPQFSSRISQFIEFKACDLADARLVSHTLCEVEISEELIASMHRKSQGNIRNMVVALSLMESYAKELGVARLAESDWGNRPMFLGSELES